MSDLQPFDTQQPRSFHAHQTQELPVTPPARPYFDEPAGRPPRPGSNPTAVLPTMAASGQPWLWFDTDPAIDQRDYAVARGSSANHQPPAAPTPAYRPALDLRRATRGTRTASTTLAVLGLAGFAVSLFGLPIDDRTGPVYFPALRHAAAQTTVRFGTSSVAGGQVATLWWRFGALLAVLTFAGLVALLAIAEQNRRLVGALLGTAGLGIGGLLAVAGLQTADLDRQAHWQRFVRESAHHFAIGYWGAGFCCGVLVLSGLVAGSQPRGS